MSRITTALEATKANKPPSSFEAPLPEAINETNDLPSEFKGRFINYVRNFNEFGSKTVCFDDAGISYFVNEFWTSGQRRSHSIHEISYRACFKAQLPDFFIRNLTVPGDAVHDPFMGRGTTPVQSALTGRGPVGSDINPLSMLLTRPRLKPPSLDAIAARLREIPWDSDGVVRDDLLVFYHPETLKKLTALRGWLLERAPLSQTNPDVVDDWIRMVALNRLTGHSPGFFSIRTMPPNQAVGIESQKRMNLKTGTKPPTRDVVAIILKKSRTLLSDGFPPRHPPAALYVEQADATKNIADSSIALTVTSPPFLDIVQYADDNWLRCWFAGIDVESIAIGMHRTEHAWTAMVRGVLIEQARIVRTGGHVAFEVGEVRGGKVLLERLVWQAADGLPFERLAVIVNQQEFTKTANCWGVSNNTAGTNTNRIVLLRRK